MYGSHSLAYSTLQPGLRYFFSENRSGFIAYWLLQRGCRNSRLVLGDPICSSEEAPALIKAFITETEAVAKSQCCFWQIGPQTGRILTESGFFVNPMGDDPIVDLAGFSLRGKDRKYLRGCWNQAAAAHVTYREVSDPGTCATDLSRISSEWLRTRSLHPFELRFLVRPLECSNELGVRKFVAERDGTPLAFVVFDPLYEGGKPIGYYGNFMRSIDRELNRLRTAVVIHAALRFRSEGHRIMTIGLSPSCQVFPVRSFRSSLVTRVTTWAIYRWCNWLYSFNGLEGYKSHYKGSNNPVYFATRNRCVLRDFFDLLEALGIECPPKVPAGNRRLQGLGERLMFASLYAVSSWYLWNERKG